MGRAGFNVWHCLIAGLVHGFLKSLFKKKSILMDHKCIVSFTFLVRESSRLSGLLEQINSPSFFINTKVISVFSVLLKKITLHPSLQNLYMCVIQGKEHKLKQKKKKKIMQTKTWRQLLLTDFQVKLWPTVLHNCINMWMPDHNTCNIKSS